MYIPLHVKSDFSLGYGTASVDDVVAKGAALRYPALSLTDIENLYGQVRFHDQCRLHGIRPLTGVELREDFESRRGVGRRSGRIILLAMNRSGYGSLCRIVSHRRGGLGKREPAGENLLPLVLEHAEGLWALSDDPAVVEELVRSGRFPRMIGLLLIRPEKGDIDRARQEAAARLGVRLVADLDVVFFGKGDHSLHLLQLAIRQGRPFEEVQSAGECENEERWLRSPAEAEALFPDVADALRATVEIAEECRFDLSEIEVHLPKDDLDGEQAAQRLRDLCLKPLAGRFSPPLAWTRAHSTRLDAELATFNSLGFSRFMLVVAEILIHCREEGIPVVRGSAVSSLVLYLLGGSPVDPLAHGLLFERFLHSGKSAWPDVDIDLPWHRRDSVIDWIYRKFGRDRVAMVAAHHAFGYRSALQEGLKAWDIRPALVERLCRALPSEDMGVEDVDFLGLAAAVHNEDPLTDARLDLYCHMKELETVLPLVRRLVTRPRHVAVHPGGIVVGRDSLSDLLPLERAPKGVVITQYDLLSVARLGLAKIDLLGNRCLSELEEALTLAGYPAPLRLESIPAADETTLALIDRADTIGCFQLESPAMRSLLARLPIRSANDIVAALALIRPGAAAGKVKETFIRRARGEEAADLVFPGMEERLRETYGLLLYEEDIMVLLSRIGGLTLEEADEVRRAIVESGEDPGILAVLKADFLEQASRRGIQDAGVAGQAWETAARFAAYSFNKAHAASYGLLAYYSAYSKAHHPLEFACALLNHHQGFYPLRTEAAELVRMGVELQGPHVNASRFHSHRSEVPGERGLGAIRVGLDKVKGLSVRAAEDILRERSNDAFCTLRDLLERVRLSSGEITALLLCGAGDGLSPLARDNYPFAHEAALEKLRQGCRPSELDHLTIPQPAASEDKTHLYQALVRVRNELRYLEMHLLAHPMALLREEAARYRCATIGGGLSASAGTLLRMAVLIAAMRRVPTRQGAMQFLTMEDETGLLEATVLPAAYSRIGNVVTTSGPYMVEGKLRRQQGAVHLEVFRMAPFRQRQRPFGK